MHLIVAKKREEVTEIGKKKVNKQNLFSIFEMIKKNDLQGELDKLRGQLDKKEQNLSKMKETMETQKLALSEKDKRISQVIHTLISVHSSKKKKKEIK
ncbi:hypothetical protein RFI_04502 [Reticulomyxa filosa]|uniref:Uncharacterized protein n=1 Tax=Reticulomyxa filosa TaxID=46433 RepID=X6P3F1_RETFI|nr:hypothetical protein RFI_04502 [Reticulomyxa filosa]|eukprot:ETO32614.1 hypothetical protein RFI_04502 [Reticulomyxa filosa]